MRRARSAGLAGLLMLWLAPAQAEELMMVRLARPFPEAMSVLQRAIADHGYQVTRIQRVDVGLTSRGFATAEYRVVFFGKTDEMKRLPDRHPELIPYLPLKIVLFAEGETTLVLTYNPTILAEAYSDRALSGQFRQWERDLRSIFDQYARAK